MPLYMHYILYSIYTGVCTNLALEYQIYLAHNFRIIATATTWILQQGFFLGYESIHSDMKIRKHFAWVSDMSCIKWNNLAITNPAKYQGIVICNNKIYIYKCIITYYSGTLVQFRGMLFHIAFPNNEKLFGYQIFFNDTTIEYKKLPNDGLLNCKVPKTNDKEECIPDRGDKYIHNIHHVIPIHYHTKL